ncbi:hypothetical protein [Candidatus Palauibacter sp.]|uniref:hypothetical protein n=1 Tax=Candidatus Palauibacter sp. TaxID=3101350 RepID=UPI003AF28BFD
MRVETGLSDDVGSSAVAGDQHPDELFLQLKEIELRTTQVGRPQSHDRPVRVQLRWHRGP